MKIAICDDEKQLLINIMSLLMSYEEERHTKLYCKSYENALDLLSAMDHENYDLVFLDILMPGINGIQTAREIRQKNENIKIVFLTSSTEYAVESYSVQAFNYLLKPVIKERLFPVLDQIADLLRKPYDSLTIQTQSSIFRLPYIKIEYIEIMSKTLYFHLTDGSIKKVRGNLSQYEPLLLSRPDFCKIHRSYMVNLNWVAEIRNKELTTMSGHRVPIARSACQQVRTAYTEFLFEDSQITNHSGGKD